MSKEVMDDPSLDMERENDWEPPSFVLDCSKLKTITMTESIEVEFSAPFLPDMPKEFMRTSRPVPSGPVLRLRLLQKNNKNIRSENNIERYT
jgi:hypothetical protein